MLLSPQHTCATPCGSTRRALAFTSQYGDLPREVRSRRRFADAVSLDAQEHPDGGVPTCPANAASETSAHGCAMREWQVNAPSTESLSRKSFVGLISSLTAFFGERAPLLSPRANAPIARNERHCIASFGGVRLFAQTMPLSAPSARLTAPKFHMLGESMVKGESFWILGTLGDDALLERVHALIRTDREVTARLLAHLNEVEERRLHLKQATSSMFAYCVERLKMSEDEAGRRLAAARIARKFPAIYQLLAQGKLSVSVIGLLKHHLTADNHAELLAAVAGQSFRQAEALLAARFPSPDAADLIRKLPLRAPSPVTAGLEPAPRSESPATSRVNSKPGLPPERVRMHVNRGLMQPLSADNYKIQFTAERPLKEKLELARDLMAHANPDRSLAVVFERALDLLIADLKKKRFAETSRPHSVHSNAVANDARSNRRVTNAVRREVVEQGGLGCSYVDDEGRRCGARALLEFDHVEPHARGGSSGPENLRVLCRAHNKFSAELAYGKEHIRAAIAARKKPA
jgi:hypothetical protein